MSESKSPATEQDRLRQLREADAEALTALIAQLGTEMTPAEARQALRNPFASEEILRQLTQLQHLLRVYEVRRDLAKHPRLPQALALRFVPGLYWRDLVAVGLDTRIRPVVRRSADRYLIDRLPSLAVGERVTIARRASPAALTHLRKDPSRPVIAALLENPRLTESTLMPMLASESTLPSVLELVAGNPRWGVRYGIRQTLSRNPRTPVAAALRILPHLKKPDLKAVTKRAGLAAAIRQRARLLLGDAV